VENKFVKALEHFSHVPFSELILNETILIIFSISQRLESFVAHPLRITALHESQTEIYQCITSFENMFISFHTPFHIFVVEMNIKTITNFSTAENVVVILVFMIVILIVLIQWGLDNNVVVLDASQPLAPCCPNFTASISNLAPNFLLLI
jgi:hypothetical protein